MIVCDKFKFVFIQNKQTACTVIADELVENYGGKHILSKHDSFEKFLKIATPQQREYKKVIGIRNPLDKTLAQYYKYTADHHDYSDPKNWEENGGWSHKSQVEAFMDVNKAGYSFEDYFWKYLNYTYMNFYFIPGFSYDFVMRFENLQDDFASMLKAVGAEPVRPLPIGNKTRVKKDTFEAYYTNDKMKAAAVKNFGPFMQQQGYALPEGWGTVPASSVIKYKLLCSASALTTKYQFLDHRKEPIRTIKLKLRGR
ncbi:sulfotransferase family 2 domain-containing protein [Alteromonas sp. C1M14]|uniref:sulfotransferase family 2 domain-containing protein n=1 Tax=Alteromonas sp. C1M14 TaxID=2841567 RepID=UPI001C09793C|nr:sulfotransferase family 2 domain-containing protein [Alteromonas sp. C1M14]MBU2979210.1 sulfotransferase family 2 domain-containing protein [Alteromonas sp. C1M14]